MFIFIKRYFVFALCLFLLEVLIAVFVHDRIIRPYIGDFLVVILIYCTVRAVVRVSVQCAALGTLLFAFLIEVLQYFNLVHLLGLQEHKLAALVMGNSFAWTDIAADIGGILLVLLLEPRRWEPIRLAVRIKKQV